MTKIDRPDGCRALIIGGSLGGLFAGNLLRQIGWDVDIFERSAHDLDSRGGGIVLQPEVIEVFRRVGVDIRTIARTASRRRDAIGGARNASRGLRIRQQQGLPHPRIYAIPEGLLADRWVEHLHRDAENLLPLPFREVVEATTQPFAQAMIEACPTLFG
jgi:2-polyprenyl-6-methoxyphenol hydroxylase-like FAD-dependent oxidoreductase